MPRKAKPTSRRSDRTKAAILTAAREHFAASGYERATIRAIARKAAIDAAMVMRYFGTKEKLFAAAAEFDLRLPDLAIVPRGTLGSAAVHDAAGGDDWHADRVDQVGDEHHRADQRLFESTGEGAPMTACLRA